jgi:hypothetical protein
MMTNDKCIGRYLEGNCSGVISGEGREFEWRDIIIIIIIIIIITVIIIIVIVIDVVTGAHCLVDYKINILGS